MSNQRTPFLYLAIALVAVVGGYLIWDNFLQPDPTDVIGTSVGNTLLDQEISGVTGGSVKLSDYRGSILVIDFMAPWCAPCKAQIVYLREVESIPGVEVVTINIDPNYNMTVLEEFGEEERITWFYGHSPFTALDFEINAIPVIMVIDPEGVIQYRGFFTSDRDFERILTPMLG